MIQYPPARILRFIGVVAQSPVLTPSHILSLSRVWLVDLNGQMRALPSSYPCHSCGNWYIIGRCLSPQLRQPRSSSQPSTRFAPMAHFSVPSAETGFPCARVPQIPPIFHTSPPVDAHLVPAKRKTTVDANGRSSTRYDARGM